MSTFAEVAGLADNALEYPEGRPFAVILGANASRVARSPTLWNAAFEAHGIAARMLPIDVGTSGLHQLLESLEANSWFLGGAVAVPHKEAVARWLGDRVASESRSIGAVNCLLRGPDARLLGTNTDGQGAVASFASRFGGLAGQTVVLLGAGGAGKAVAAFFRLEVGAGGRLVICSRSPAGASVATALGAEWVAWREIDAVLAAADVVVNCTSVGGGEQSSSSPLSAEQVKSLKPGAKVFDIVYQPSPTALLMLAEARGLTGLNGSAMNLEQAVLAYGCAAPEPKGAAVTRTAMAAAKLRFG